MQTSQFANLFCVALGLYLALTASAQPVSDAAIDQQRRAQERETQQRQRQETGSDVRLPSIPLASTGLLPDAEAPCFYIRSLQLQGQEVDHFPWLLDHADGHTQLDHPDPVQGRCLGAQGIQTVIDRLQNTLIARGYTTARVLAPGQNLQSGTLVLTLVPGYVGEMRWAPGTGQRASRWNIMPMQTGDLLNLRDVEQALENYKRVPNAEADIQITPGRDLGTSDLVISHQQSMPFRLSATADDSGTPSTGKYQGSLTFSYDNWWNLSDLFYVTLLHDLGGSDPGARGTRGQIIHYSVPFGYWLVGMTHTNNRYHQTVAGANQDYVYSGTSRNIELKLSRVLHRDAAGKTSISLKGFQRASNNYIDDAEVQVQRRVVGGLEWGLNHRRSWHGGSLEANANYRQGTGAWGSLPAPEEAFGEGTSRMRLWLLDATVQQSFSVAEQSVSYSGNWRALHNQTPLTPQDRFVIGGRFTVRGFDGLSVLMAERGWLLRNEVSTSMGIGHQAYIGIDTGQVGGPSAANLVGTQLTGGVLGVRGQLGQSARMQYDFFVGKPLRKPEQFKTSATTAGFSASVSF